MQQGSDDGHDKSSLFGMACSLNRHKAYSVSGSHSGTLNRNATQKWGDVGSPR